MLVINNLLKWSGCAFVCLGATCTAFHIGENINIYLFNAASVCYGIWGYRIKELNQVIVNLFLVIIYIVGYFFR
jgi:hypothetical protein